VTQNTGAAQAQPDTAPGPTPAAGPDAQSPTLTIRQTVRRVVVDVMVRDANNKPVHGLTAKDFLLTEDRQPQRVLSFDVYDFDTPSISRGPNAPPLPPNVFVNVPKFPERGPLYVMLYDLVNTEVEDQMTARQQILKFISTKPEGTRFAVFVNSDELYLAQEFTADQNQLYAALDPKHPKSHVPRVFSVWSKLRIPQSLHDHRCVDSHRPIPGWRARPQEFDLGGRNLPYCSVCDGRERCRCRGSNQGGDECARASSSGGFSRERSRSCCKS
jgi:hypothetical protein